MNIEIYIEYLKNDWYKLKTLPILTVEQIKDCNNDCIRMYLYCYYNYPEFYNYKKKKLLRYINENKDNLMLLVSFLGRLADVKYLELYGLSLHHVNAVNMNAYLCACRISNNIELIKYLEKKNINIYQKHNC